MLRMENIIRKYHSNIKKYLTKFNSYIQFRIDTTKYIIDKPSFHYQPLPWIGISTAAVRGEATYERWEAIQNYLKGYKSLKDIGCCAGFFCHKAAETYNMNTIGIDSDERFLRIAQYTKNNVKNGKNETFCNMLINEKNADILPQTDVTILFSIWHHWCYRYGLNKATEILKMVWSKTNHVLLFESGQEELKKKFKLPFDKKASDWLWDYLSSNLKGVKIEKVGEFAIGTYKNYSLPNQMNIPLVDLKRTVFAIIKT